MKKSILYILAGAAVLPFILFSCNKPGKSADAAEAATVTVRASIPETVSVTKVSPVAAESGMDWTWEELDKISISSATASSVFAISSPFQPKDAYFVGRPVAGSSLTVIYPADATEETLAGKSFLGQVQTGNGDMAHLEYYAVLKNLSDYDSFAFGSDWAAEHNATLKQNGVLHFALTLPAKATEVYNITVAAPSELFHTDNADGLASELSLTLEECARWAKTR